jgi:hypothetical protein
VFLFNLLTRKKGIHLIDTFSERERERERDRERQRKKERDLIPNHKGTLFLLLYQSNSLVPKRNYRT